MKTDHIKAIQNTLFCRTQRKIFWRKFVTRLFWGTIDLHSTKNKYYGSQCAPELLCFLHSSEYLPLCSAEQRHSYRFGTTWGWVNDDRIFIFGWTMSLSVSEVHPRLTCGAACMSSCFSDTIICCGWERIHVFSLMVSNFGNCDFVSVILLPILGT